MKEAEAEEAGNAMASLTAVLAEKDALFAQFEEQVAALEALRQKEAAECKQLHTALASQQRDWQQQLQTEQRKRCALHETPMPYKLPNTSAHAVITLWPPSVAVTACEWRLLTPTHACLCREELQQQLKQLEESSTAQIQSARQAAVTQAVQHSTQHKHELERAAEQQQQLRRQLQELQDALAAKESELGAVQMQLAAALESTQRLQDNHGKVRRSRDAGVRGKSGCACRCQWQLAVRHRLTSVDAACLSAQCCGILPTKVASSLGLQAVGT